MHGPPVFRILGFSEFQWLHAAWVQPVCARGSQLQLPRKSLAKNDAAVVHERKRALAMYAPAPPFTRDDPPSLSNITRDYPPSPSNTTRDDPPSPSSTTRDDPPSPSNTTRDDPPSPSNTTRDDPSSLLTSQGMTFLPF